MSRPWEVGICEPVWQSIERHLHVFRVERSGGGLSKLRSEPNQVSIAIHSSLKYV